MTDPEVVVKIPYVGIIDIDAPGGSACPGLDLWLRLEDAPVSCRCWPAMPWRSDGTTCPDKDRCDWQQREAARVDAGEEVEDNGKV